MRHRSSTVLLVLHCPLHSLTVATDFWNLSASKYYCFAWMPVHVLFLMNFWSRYNIIYIWIETSQIRDLTFVKTCRQTTGILIVLKYFISFLSSVCWWVAGDEDKMWGSLQSDSDLNTMDRLGLHGGYHLLMINNSRSVNRNTSSDGPDSLEPVTTTGCILYSVFCILNLPSWLFHTAKLAMKMSLICSSQSNAGKSEIILSY